MKELATPSVAQQRASNPAHSVWVSASAGTGKTKVLTERVLRLMLNGAKPDKILCITFTNAAAAEMANRIHSALSRWAIADDEALRKEINALTERTADHALLSEARQLFTLVVDNPDSLKIQTIHSFCQSILKRFPLEAGLAPHFRVGDEDTADTLLEDARHRLLVGEHTYLTEEQCLSVKKALEHIAVNTSDKGIEEILKALLGKRQRLKKQFQKKDGVIRYVEQIYSVLGVDRDASPKELEREFYRDTSLDRQGLKQLADLIVADTEAKKPGGMTIHAFLAASETERVIIFENYKNVFFTKDDKPKAKEIKSIITSKSLKKWPEASQVIFNEQRRLSAFFEKYNNLKTAKLSEALVHVGEGLFVLYEFLKSSQCLLDYDDLIHFTAKLLGQRESSDWIRFKLDGGIDHILVDEAQDTSPEQWLILRALCDEFFSGESSGKVERTLFVVGDEKQSIYSFQGADVSNFEAMHHTLKDHAIAAQKKWHSISLDMSFRSTEAVLKVVDEVYKDEERRRAISSADVIQHEAHRLGHAGLVELWPAVTHDEKKDTEIWPLPNEYKRVTKPALLLVDTLAERIAAWLKEPRTLLSQGRPIRPSDILILVKRRNDFVEHLIRALKQKEIPVSGLDKLKITEHLAVMDLMALGKFVLLPEDDYTLACLLKSPLFNMSEEELFALCYNRGKESLWQRVQKSNHPAKEYLSHLLSLADFGTPFEFFSRVIDADGGRKKFIARMGDEVDDPINEFLNLCLQFNSREIPSMQLFLQWLESSDITIKRNMEQPKSEVRIMTVHGAKGLQAPIVILPDTTHTYGTGKIDLLWSNDDVMLWPGGARNLSALTNDLQQKQKALMDEEALRLLYVAMTRAEDELYICGHFSNHDPKEHSWHSILEGVFKEMEDAKKVPLNFMPEGFREGYRLTCHQDQKAKEKETAEKSTAPALPAYFKKAAEKEVMSRFLSPSRLGSKKDGGRNALAGKEARIRGTAVHRLLELLPDLPKEKHTEAASVILKQFAELKDTDALVGEVLKILNDETFAPLFQKGSQAEVTLSGYIDGEKYLGQVDRLVILEKEILLVDYKTNRTPPEKPSDIPEAYLQQMAVYSQLLGKIYPNKPIKACLLWTNTPILMPIEKQLLARYSTQAA